MLITGLLFCLTASTIPATGQEHSQNGKAVSQGTDKGAADSTNSPIEVKTDRFSNVTTVTLKPQAILDKPDHIITMSIETKLGEKTIDEWERELIKSYAKFESQSKTPVDFGDEELHFIINGKPLNLGKTNMKLDPFPKLGGNLKPGFAIRNFGLGLFDRDALGLLSKANQIEMRLGSVEMSFNNQLATTLREYAAKVLAQHKISKERKQ
jgi:hypothetical protein